MRNMVIVSCKLIGACVESGNELKNYVFEKVYTLIANIIRAN